MLLAAREPGVAGQLLDIVQLDLATRPNSLLRAEVSKLLVHTQARHQGIPANCSRLWKRTPGS